MFIDFKFDSLSRSLTRSLKSIHQCYALIVFVTKRHIGPKFTSKLTNLICGCGAAAAAAADLYSTYGDSLVSPALFFSFPFTLRPHAFSKNRINLCCG